MCQFEEGYIWAAQPLALWAFPFAQKDPGMSAAALLPAPSDEIQEGLMQQHKGLDTSDPLLGRCSF